MDRIAAGCPGGMLEPFFFPEERSNLPPRSRKPLLVSHPDTSMVHESEIEVTK